MDGYGWMGWMEPKLMTETDCGQAPGSMVLRLECGVCGVNVTKLHSCPAAEQAEAVETLRPFHHHQCSQFSHSQQSHPLLITILHSDAFYVQL